MLIFISTISLIFATVALLYIFGVYDKIFIRSNYKKLKIYNNTNITFEEYRYYINELSDVLSLTPGSYKVILLKEYPEDVDFVIRINKNYFAIRSEALIFLFNENDVLIKQVKRMSRAVKKIYGK